MNTIKKNCLNCNVSFKARSADHKRGRAKYCCRSCSAVHTNKLRPKIEHQANVVCAYCDQGFYLNDSKKKNSKSGFFFCCREHKDLAQRLGGIEAIHPPHYNTGNGESSYRVMALRYLPHICNRCTWCKHTEALLVHHIDHDRSNNDLSNLEILCPTCHVIEHKYPHLI